MTRTEKHAKPEVDCFIHVNSTYVEYGAFKAAIIKSSAFCIVSWKCFLGEHISSIFKIDKLEVERSEGGKCFLPQILLFSSNQVHSVMSQNIELFTFHIDSLLFPYPNNIPNRP
jgi:hypothetical protein